MNREEAIKYYARNKNIKFIKEYVDADDYCVVHENDRSLTPIYIPLPKPPKWEYIDGFGEKKENQVFTRVEYPKKLSELEKRFSTIEQIWKEIETNPVRYKDEVAWIRKQWYHIINGYWCFINGKPTFITGIFYAVLNFWHYEGKWLPEYRDRDRKTWLYDWYMELLPNFVGFNFPKHRREGATSKAGGKNYFRSILRMAQHGGIQSKTDEHAKMVFQDHIVKPWRKLKFFLKPVYDGTDNPKSELNFVPPARSSIKDKDTGEKGSLISKEHGLGGDISYRSSDKYAYDAYILHFYHGDEVGKTKDVDVNDRYHTIRECLTEGSGIHGCCWNTSTVEEMEQEGGENFKKLCDNSMFHDCFENKNGRTISWLSTLFIPADEGRNEFIGKYGESIVDDPTPEQLEYLKKRYPNKKRYTGAREDILNMQAAYEEKGDHVGLMAYKRKYPLEYRDCWISANFDTGMPMDVIEERIYDLSIILGKKDNQEVFRGNFVRTDANDPDSTVVFHKDPDGRWDVSFLFDKIGQSNKRVMRDGIYYPDNLSFGIAGGDPFAFTKTKNRRMSNGAGSVFMYKDAHDRGDIDVENWIGNRFICTYNFRPETKEEYGEDMIKMIQYYGIPMFAENNRPDLNDYLINRGYGGYVKYRINKKTGKFEVTPGFFTRDPEKQAMWSLLRDYLRLHGHREMHMEILQECRNIQGVEQMVDYDLFTAAGAALLGAQEREFEETIINEYSETDLKDWF